MHQNQWSDGSSDWEWACDYQNIPLAFKMINNYQTGRDLYSQFIVTPSFVQSSLHPCSSIAVIFLLWNFSPLLANLFEILNTHNIPSNIKLQCREEMRYLSDNLGCRRSHGCSTWAQKFEDFHTSLYLVCAALHFIYILALLWLQHLCFNNLLPNIALRKVRDSRHLQ